MTTLKQTWLLRITTMVSLYYLVCIVLTINALSFISFKSTKANKEIHFKVMIKFIQVCCCMKITEKIIMICLYVVLN